MTEWTSPLLTRRSALQAGAVGMLSLADLFRLEAATTAKEKSVIFVFLTGGLSHLDSFDMKPDAPDSVRSEFKAVATKTPGVRICEHLPLLAARSEQWALVRSVATNTSSHGPACHVMLTGRLDTPPGFTAAKAPPTPDEWPSIPSQVTHALHGRTRMPPAVILPQPSINEANKVRPGQYAGKLGPRWEAWHLNIAAKCALGNGACPHCFRFEGTPFEHGSPAILESPDLDLPEGGQPRLQGRVSLLHSIEKQRAYLESFAESAKLDRHRQQAISVLTDVKTRGAFEINKADPRTIERYGKNKFGLSLLMASRLVAAGVRLVQVNLGKNSSWDTHRRNFPNLKDNLFPYFDRSIAALLDDLSERGLLESTLVLVAGEFGRTPKINKNAGRDHWGPVNTVLFAGGGVKGGNVIGASDKIAAQPAAQRQTPENLAATLYQALGIPRAASWSDTDGRPFGLYRDEPVEGLM